MSSPVSTHNQELKARTQHNQELNCWRQSSCAANLQPFLVPFLLYLFKWNYRGFWVGSAPLTRHARHEPVKQAAIPRASTGCGTKGIDETHSNLSLLHCTQIRSLLHESANIPNNKNYVWPCIYQISKAHHQTSIECCINQRTNVYLT
jgi:hypothetical protein